MYQQEIIRREKEQEWFDKEKEKEMDLEDAVDILKQESSKSANVQLEEYICEICLISYRDRKSLLEHYSGSHMVMALKEMFGHLVLEYGKCKLCDFKVPRK